MIKKIITTTTLIAAAAAMANAALDSGTVLVDIVTGSGLASYENTSGTWNTFAVTTGAPSVQKTITVNNNGTGSYVTSTGATVSGFSVGVNTNIPIWNAGNTTSIGIGKFDVGTAGINKGISTTNTNVMTWTISGLVAGQSYNLALGGNGGAGMDAAKVSSTVLTLTGGAFGADSSVATASSGGSFTGTPNSTVTFNNQNLGAYAAMWENVTASDGGTLSFTLAAPPTALSGDGTKANIAWLAVTAIPEPSMFGLLAGLGALALVGARRRRK